MKYIILILYILLFAWIGEQEGYNIAIVGSIIRGVGASKNAKRLQKRADGITAVRPEYEIPQEIRDYLANTTNMAQGDMAGYGRMMNQAQGNTANQLNQAANFADSGTSLLQSLSINSEGQRRNEGDINMRNTGFKQNSMNAMNRALMDMGNFQDQKFDYNENQPFQQADLDKRNFEAAAIDQRNAATDAWSSVADGVVGLGMTALGMPMGAGGGSLFGKLFGKQPEQPQAGQGFRANTNVTPSKFNWG